jgi:hypothetical protein
MCCISAFWESDVGRYLSAFLIMKGMFIVRYGNTQQMYIMALLEPQSTRFVTRIMRRAWWHISYPLVYESVRVVTSQWQLGCVHGLS